MKKILIVLLVISTFSFAKSWDYLIYTKTFDFSKKPGIRVSIINDGKNVYVGKSGLKESGYIADTKMINKFLKKDAYTRVYEINILNILGNEGWELINIQTDKSPNVYYFKK